MKYKFLIKVIRLEGKNISQVLISIVSHGQGVLIKKLLHDLASNLKDSQHCLKIVVTLNIPENESFLSDYPNLHIQIIRNKFKKGYGENHNFAFNSVSSDYFLVINPDVRIKSNFIDVLIPHFNSNVGVVAPKVLNSLGSIEDSFRKFPTFFTFIKRKFLNYQKFDYTFLSSEPQEVDWVAGMFMFFESQKFRKISGFDERYFMYLEDADICRRLQKKMLSTIYVQDYEVIHDARRSSRKNIKYLFWHIKSMIRFLS